MALHLPLVVTHETPLDQLFEVCLRERRGAHADSSPACVELTRRTLAGDEAAWGLFRRLFEPLMRSWIGVQQHVEPDDVLQEALFAFARWAPAHADLAGGDVGRTLAFLRRCTKTALLMQLRKTSRPPYLPLDAVQIAATDDGVVAAERRIMIHERAAQLLTTEQERIVFRELLVNGRKPREILAAYGDEFVAMDVLRGCIQRVLRRLRKDLDLHAML